MSVLKVCMHGVVLSVCACWISIYICLHMQCSSCPKNLLYIYNTLILKLFAFVSLCVLYRYVHAMVVHVNIFCVVAQDILMCMGAR